MYNDILDYLPGSCDLEVISILKDINNASHFKSKIIGHFIKSQDKNIICNWCQKFT